MDTIDSIAQNSVIRMPNNWDAQIYVYIVRFCKEMYTHDGGIFDGLRDLWDGADRCVVFIGAQQPRNSYISKSTISSALVYHLTTAHAYINPYYKQHI